MLLIKLIDEKHINSIVGFNNMKTTLSPEEFVAFYEENLARPEIPSEADLIGGWNLHAEEFPPKADLILDIPYIHQLWDTPTNFHGSWACGATSVAMVLAYYGLLEHVEDDSIFHEKHNSKFGHYISESFEFDGHHFTDRAKTENGYGSGLYAACVNNNGDASLFEIEGECLGMLRVLDIFLNTIGNKTDYFTLPKVKGSDRQMEQGITEQRFKQCLEAGHPVIVSCDIHKNNKIYGHIMVVRGYYTNEETGETMWIVNDPYGFDWNKKYHGERIAYEYGEMNPKYMAVIEGPYVPQKLEIGP